MSPSLLKSGTIHAAGVAFSVIVGVVFARFLGPAEFGRYAFAMAIVNLLVVLTEFGLPSVMLRQASNLQSSPLARSQLLKSFSGLITINTAVLFALLFLSAWLVSAMTFDLTWSISYKSVIMIGLLSVPLLALVKLLSAALRGSGHLLTGQLTEFVFRNLFLAVCGCVTFLLWEESRIAEKAMILHFIAVLITLCVSCLLVRRLNRGTSTKINGHTPPQAPSPLKSGFFFLLAGGAMLINTQLDILMVGGLLGDQEVGLYRVAAQAAILTGFGLQIVQTAFAPSFSRAQRDGNVSSIKALWQKGSLVGGGIGLLALFVFIVFGDDILVSVFGQEYLPSYTALLILSAGYAGNALCGPVGIILSMGGHERLVASLLWFSTAINAILNFILIPTLGITGAAISTATTLLTLHVILLLAILKSKPS